MLSLRRSLPTRTLHARSFTQRFRSSRPALAYEPPLAQSIGKPSLFRPILWAFAASSGAYITAAILTDWDTVYWEEKLAAAGPISWTLTPRSPPTSTEMKRARLFSMVEDVKKDLEDLKRSLKGVPNYINMLILHSYVQCAQTWVNTSEGMRICWKVAALNAGVWITWQVPRLQPFMKRAFMHHPLSSRYYTMLTSVFSHSNFLHGLFNMMALSSFGGATVLWMEKSQGTANSRLQESTAQYHFLAFFATAGIFSSLVSHIVSTRFRFPRALKAFSAPGTPSSSSSTLGSKMAGAGAGLSQQAAASAIKSKHNILPSLGASGAVYSTLAITALAFPETHVSLIFPPTGSIPIEYGFAGLVLIDTVGILRGWRLFDHWAHLGGAAFGAFYWMYGPAIWDANRVQAAALRLSLFGKAPPMDDVD